MTYDYVLCEIEERLAIVTVNRPQMLNSLNRDVIRDLLNCMKEIQKNDLADCVIITGAGRSFIAGADIGVMVEMKGNEGRDWTKEGMDLMDYIEAMKVPVIAAINGFALGGGCELAMACDIRIASKKAKFSQPETGLGLIPGYGGTQRLPRIVGKGMAKYLIFTNEMIDGEEAYRIGLVEKLTEPEELMDVAIATAKKILSHAPVATRMAKRAINAATNTDIATGINYELETYEIAFQTEDRVEGMKAFLEKRKANFKNC